MHPRMSRSLLVKPLNTGEHSPYWQVRPTWLRIVFQSSICPCRQRGRFATHGGRLARSLDVSEAFPW